MQSEGFNVQPGMTIQYVIVDVKNKDSKKRYKSLDSYNGKFDLNWYKEMLVRATYCLLEPFGVSEEMLSEETSKVRQIKLNSFIKKHEIKVLMQ